MSKFSRAQEQDCSKYLKVKSIWLTPISICAHAESLKKLKSFWEGLILHLMSHWEFKILTWMNTLLKLRFPQNTGFHWSHWSQWEFYWYNIYRDIRMWDKHKKMCLEVSVKCFHEIVSITDNIRNDNLTSSWNRSKEKP